jgi:cation diffusion facilitator family transporter
MDMNMHAAYLHVITDLMFSFGVFLAGVLVWYYPEYSIIDPFVTLCFSFVIITSTMNVVRKVLGVLFEGVPDHIDFDKVKASILAIEDVTDVHDLHIWAISSERSSASCHAVVASVSGRANSNTTTADIIRKVNVVLRKYDIDHTTIQIEEDSKICNPQEHLHCY